MTRYVFDTNVIVSALLFTASKPGLAFLEALDNGTILASAELLTELNDVLSRPKFGDYIEPGESERFLGAFVREVRFVEIRETVRVCRDPKDDQVLELAVSGNADLIVTGDTDLLALDRFRGIEIITPADLLRRLG